MNPLREDRIMGEEVGSKREVQKKQNIQLKNEKLNVRIHNNDVWIKQLLKRQMMKFDIF